MEQTRTNLLTQSGKANGNVILLLLERITRPHSSITDIEVHRQSRLLASLTLTLFVTGGLAAVLLTLKSPDGIPSTVKFLVPGLLLTFALFFLNRSGRYRVSAAVFVAQNFVLVYFTPVMTHDLSWLLFASMVTIITAILMPANVTTLLFVGGLGLQLVIGILAPTTTTITNLATSIVFLITSSLLLVFISYRSGLERERREELQAANQ